MLEKYQFGINLLKFNKHIPANCVNFRVKRGLNVSFSNGCSVNYFLLAFWTTFEIEPSIINDKLENLSIKSTVNNDICKILCEVVKLVDWNDWGKAKYVWLHDFLKKEIPLTKIYDCFGSTKEFVFDFYKPLQEYTYKIVCECHGEKSPSTTYEITIDYCENIRTPTVNVNVMFATKLNLKSLILKRNQFSLLFIPIWTSSIKKLIVLKQPLNLKTVTNINCLLAL